LLPSTRTLGRPLLHWQEGQRWASVADSATFNVDRRHGVPTL